MSCVFCDKKKIKDDIIWQSENFYLKVGFGIAAPGHVMIIPKKHYLSLASLPYPLFKEYREFKKKTLKALKKLFAKPFLIEYGNSGSVRHAHIHLIPLESKKYKLKSYLKQIVKKIPK